MGPRSVLPLLRQRASMTEVTVERIVRVTCRHTFKCRTRELSSLRPVTGEIKTCRCSLPGSVSTVAYRDFRPLNEAHLRQCPKMPGTVRRCLTHHLRALACSSRPRGEEMVKDGKPSRYSKSSKCVSPRNLPRGYRAGLFTWHRAPF